MSLSVTDKKSLQTAQPPEPDDQGRDAGKTARTRHTWIAIILSLVNPPLGYFYGNHVVRGLVVAVIGLLISTVYQAIGWKIPEYALVAFVGMLVIAVLFTAAVIIDIWRVVTDRTRGGRGWMKVFGGLVVLFTVSATVAAVVDIEPVRTFVLPSGARSMEPTLRPGDRILVNCAIYRKYPPHPGDLLVFNSPEETARPYTRRVVVCPGQPHFGADGDQVSENRDAGFVCFRSDNPKTSATAGVGRVPQFMIIGRVDFIYWPPSAWGKVATGDPDTKISGSTR